LTQQKAAQIAGVRREMWGKYEKKGAEPGAKALAELSREGFDALYVLTGERASAPAGAPQFSYKSSLSTTLREDEIPWCPTLTYKAGHKNLKFVLVPRYVMRASAGAGMDNGQVAEESVGEIAFEALWMRRNFGRAGSGFALLDVAGSSMEPTLWDGETILVDLQSRELISGSVYVLRDGDELLVKRLQRLIGGGVEVVSDNPSYRSQVVPQADELGIVGRVVWPRVR